MHTNIKACVPAFSFTLNFIEVHPRDPTLYCDIAIPGPATTSSDNIFFFIEKSPFFKKSIYINSNHAQKWLSPADGTLSSNPQCDRDRIDGLAALMRLRSKPYYC